MSDAWFVGIWFIFLTSILVALLVLFRWTGYGG